jgi:hypothetical protein
MTPHDIERYKRLIERENHPLSDIEYFERTIIDMYRFNSNKICIIKDPNSVYAAVSPVFANMIGCSIETALNKKDEEIPYRNVAELAETFYKQDREVIKSKTSKHMLDVINYNTGLAILKVVKKPIINPATDNVLGVFYSATEFKVNTVLSTILSLYGSRFGQDHSGIDISPSEVLNNSNLSELEFDILYCICLGINTTGSITQLLSCIYNSVIDDTQIDKVFKSLYEKLSCSNHLQLLEIAIANKLHLKLPRKLLPFGSFDLPQHEICKY